jgi:hypothetical protein
MSEKEHAASFSITMEQFCRALAAHLLLASHPNLLHSVMAPETAEQTADFIHRFACGEFLDWPRAGIDNNI